LNSIGSPIHPPSRCSQYDKKGKAKQIQPPQDNTTAGVNKHVEGETVICRLCHKEGHKSFQCKAKTGDKQNLKQNFHHLHQQGRQKGCYTILDQKEKEWKGDSNQGQQASQQWEMGQTHMGVKGNYFNHEKHQEGLDPEREVRSSKDYEEFGDLAKLGCISWDASYWIKSIAKWVSAYFGPKFPPMTKVTRFIAFPFLDMCIYFSISSFYLSYLVLHLVFTFDHKYMHTRLIIW
jgi:hypothetical protein